MQVYIDNMLQAFGSWLDSAGITLPEALSPPLALALLAALGLLFVLLLIWMPLRWRRRRRHFGSQAEKIVSDHEDSRTAIQLDVDGSMSYQPHYEDKPAQQDRSADQQDDGGLSGEARKEQAGAGQ